MAYVPIDIPERGPVERFSLSSLTSSCRNLLILLPSCRTGFDIANRLAATGRILILAEPRFMHRVAPNLMAFVRSPPALWCELKTSDTLSCAVISFADQVIGNGPSFQQIEIRGIEYFFSLVDFMILTRFSPQLLMYAEQIPGQGDEYVTLAVASVKPPPQLTHTTMVATMKSMYDSYLAALGTLDERWYAEHIHSLRGARGHHQIQLGQLIEIESMVRLQRAHFDEHGPWPEILEEIRFARRRWSEDLKSKA